MSNLKKISILLMFLFSSSALWAIENRDFVGGNQNSGGNTTTNSTFRAACIEARAETDLDINNVRARLRSGGDLWWDGNNARYIVPNVDPASGQPEVSSLFAGGIWLGAFDDGGNLILAAQTYRQDGNDYWTGPLNTTTGTIEKADCEKWDRFFGVLGAEIDALRADYFEPDATGQSDETIDVRPARNLLGWPGRGNPYFAEIYGFELPDQDLAPFIEPPGKEDGIYNPYDGDHPVIEVVGCVPDYYNPVYADQMEWWVYNDNGNIHSNTNGQPMFMEIHGLAFGYRTTDAINNMTFYRYKLLNRNNLSLNDTYFSLWSDPDLGCYLDDYIGVDTTTGMGYVYNADANDDATCGTGGLGYGSAKIPALGVDYFRGPLDSAGNLIGLSSFVYYENSSDPIRGNPGSAIQYYRLMSGFWLNNDPISFGGTGSNGAGAVKFPYVFPSFPNEGGAGVWSMCSESVSGNDYRFLHTSGPFVLLPGATNELISGVVWVPEVPDYPCPSLSGLVEADVLAQNLFDDCFKITDGPDAPYMDIIEMENELVLNLSYIPSQNNYQLNYKESPARLRGFGGDSSYTFQGYKVYQVTNENISVTDLEDPEKARLIFQVDLQDSISKIVNWTAFNDPDVQAFIPEIMVDGENKGVKHTFHITEDKFTDKNPKLVNHKSYYFCVVAYGHNEYQKYDPVLNEGQAEPYLQGRRNFRVYTGIPRNNDPEYSGAVINASYGDRPEITRIDGRGNGGGLFLEFADEATVIDSVIANGFIGRVTYAEGGGPVDIKIVDPLRVAPGKFELYINDENYIWTRDQATGLLIPTLPATAPAALGDSLFWVLKTSADQADQGSWSSYQPLTVNYEQYIPELGISLTILDIDRPGANGISGYIGSSVTYTDSNSVEWFVGVQDGAGPDDFLKTGNAQDDQSADIEQDYSKLEGGWHPVLLADSKYRPDEYYITTSEMPQTSTSFTGLLRSQYLAQQTLLTGIRNVNVVITPDKSKWSRCIVTETANLFHTSGLGLTVPSGKGALEWKKTAPGRDKDGNLDGSQGMSWFPGYAYDVETGQRLNVFFGENSFYNGAFFDENLFPGSSTGNDMLFNPTDAFRAAPFNGFPILGDANVFLASIYGGQHAIYVSNTPYDDCAGVIAKYNQALPSGFASTYHVMKDRILAWATFCYLADGTSMKDNNGADKLDGHVPPSEVTFKMRVTTPYDVYNATGSNKKYPKYEFDLTKFSPTKQDATTAESALDHIGVVPNPYYAYSEYEQTETQNVVKITNIPATCQVRIYGLDGRLIREYKIAQDYNATTRSGIARIGANGSGDIEEQVKTSLDWDLKNTAGVPVGSGVYLIHVVVDGVGERVVKSFVINRSLDAQKL